MEVDNEVKGNENSYTTEFRQYDPRLGRWLSPYVAFNNNPIYYTDPLGLEGEPEIGFTCEDELGESRTYAGNGEWKSGSLPTIGTNPSESVSNESIAMSYNHTHNEVINLIFDKSGGNDFYNQHTISNAEVGTVSDLAPHLQQYIEYLKNSPSEVAHNEYTQPWLIYMAPRNMQGSEVAFVNWMLGDFISGINYDNYYFPPGNVFSEKMKNSSIVSNAMSDWKEAGMPDEEWQTKSAYGLGDLGKNFFTNGTVNTVEDFVGSADVFIKKINANMVMVTIINVTSLTSGDYDKQVTPYHGGAWPSSTVEGTKDFYYPIPYSNISQIFQFFKSY